MSAMRVDQVSQMAAIGYGKSRVQTTKSPAESSFRDYLSLSGTGKDIGTLRQALTKVPDVREDLVADIKSRISDGTYHVSDSDTAEKIANAYFGLA